MDIQEAKVIFFNILNSTPGVVKLYPLNLNQPVENEDVNEEMDLMDMLIVIVNEVSNHFEFKCRIDILYGISAKQLISRIYKQLGFELKKHNILKFDLRIYIKGVSYE